MSSISREITVEPYGDSAVLVRRDCPDGDIRWASMQYLSNALRESDVPGIQGIVATFDTMLIEFDPLATDAQALESALRRELPDHEPVIETGRVVDIPLLYGGEFGPDLPAVAEELGLSQDEVIEQHAATNWRVAFNGAPAGTPLHDGSPFARSIRRMPQPRLRIPAGTVALSGHQGTIYTVQAPGGWRLIGRTPLHIVNPGRDNFVAIQPGDVLRFRPITQREFDATPAVFIGELL